MANQTVEQRVKEKFIDDAGNLRLQGLIELDQSIRAVAEEVDRVETGHGDLIRTAITRMERMQVHLEDLEKEAGKRPLPKPRSKVLEKEKGSVIQ